MPGTKFRWFLTMARKPPDWRQPSLFNFDQAKTPEPQDNATFQPDGDPHAIQDDPSRTPATAAGDARGTSQATEAASDPGDVRPRTEGRARSLEGDAVASPAGQPSSADSERSNGTGPEGHGGSFAARVGQGRRGSAFPGRSDGLHQPQTHASRLNQSRRQRSLFDSDTDNTSPATPAPPAPISDGTLLAPPGRASGKPVPPEGLPQFSPGTVATRAEPRP